MKLFNRAEPADDRAGVFITLEGPDGAGKSTQIPMIVERLRAIGFDVVSCRDPGGTPLGDRIRSLLLDRSDLSISLRAEMFLYMASRAQLVADVIEPALKSNKVVVCDRFLLSNVVYQLCAGELDPKEIWLTGEAAVRGLYPDLTIVIDVPREIARMRVGGARDRIEDRDESYQSRVRIGYQNAAGGYLGGPMKYLRSIRIVQGSDDILTVNEKIMKEIEDVLAKRTRS